MPVCIVTYAQEYQYAPSERHPYGLPNPDAPAQIKDFAEMTLGVSVSTVWIAADGTYITMPMPQYRLYCPHGREPG
jgi:hypothetical protein